MTNLLRVSVLASLSALALPARAQDAPPHAASVEETAADTAADTAGTEPAGTAPSTPAVPPIMVVVTASGRVPPELVEALRTRLVEQVTPMAGGRPVLPLRMESLSAALVACGADAACIGGQIAGAGAIGAIVATLARRTARGPVTLTLDIRDPVSGSPRIPTQTLALDPAGDVVALLSPLTEALRPVMFSPPPPPPELLVTVNVDGATVRIDDEVIGTTPVAAVRLTPGRHVIMVTADGYSGTRRELELDPGERERLDLTLLVAEVVAMDEVIAADGTVITSRPWYEEWWVWTIVGGVVVVGVGVGVGVGVATSGPPPDPMGIPLPPIR
jgi:PEGA domain